MSTSEQNKQDKWTFMRNMAVEDARRWLLSAVESYEHDVSELRRYVERFDDAVAAKTTTPVSVISNFVHLAVQTGSNARLDLAVDRASALALTQKGE
jgi:hypothetical protein